MSGNGKTTTIIVVAVVAVIAVGVGAFFIGQSSADADGAEDTGRAQGESEVRAEYAEGKPAYTAIYRRGFQAGQAEGSASGESQGTRRGYDRGQQVGLEQGEQRGEQQGEREGEQQGEREGEQQGEAAGTRTGAEEALGNLQWKDGAFYVVRIAEGSGNVPYRVNDRKVMEPNEEYHICSFNPDLICSQAVPTTK